MVKKPRAPHGQGKAALMLAERMRRARFLADHIWEHVDLDVTEDTGRLIPRGQLRKRGVRAMFSFIVDGGECHGRFVTDKVCKKTIRMLHSRLDFKPPCKNIHEWVRKEAQVLKSQCRRAKQLRWSMSKVDQTDTLVQEAPFLCIKCII